MKKFISIFILVSFFITGQVGTCPVYAQDFVLPAPGVMVQLSPEFNPPVLKGIKVHPDNPFLFDFILDKGDSKLSNNQLKIESSKLIKYFLASLTIPEKDLWVNLSPYEKRRIVPESFGQTEMGRDLLAEDYMLKQITASLIYPEGKTGKSFWNRVYAEAENKFGTTDIPVNTFNKVWIIPKKAVVYENSKAGSAYVVESELKVMLEQDYLSLQKHEGIGAPPKVKNTSQLGFQIVREIVIPQLTKEVNEDKNFSQLRQVYNSLILATWYKKKIKDSILEQVYANKSKVAGVNIDDPQEIEKIYHRYLQAFKKGAYNYIKEEQDPVTQDIKYRKYFSGGMLLSDQAMNIVLKITSSQDNLPLRKDFAMVSCRFNSYSKAGDKKIDIPPADAAMNTEPVGQWYSTYVKDQLEQLPLTEVGSLIRDSWQTALLDPNNVVLHSVTQLSQLGVSPRLLKNLIHSLIGSGVDVTDPWGASAQIRVFLDLSPQWFGEDLSGYSDKLSAEASSMDLQKEPALPPDDIILSPGSSLFEIRSAYRSFMKYRKGQILTAGDFYSNVTKSNAEADHFMKRLLKTILSRIWHELGIPQDSPYFIYFREFKTFASDGDIFYIGPRQEEVLVRMMQILNLLGVNMDDDSGFAIRQHVAKKDLLDIDVLGFFYNGNIMEYPEGIFSEYFSERILKNGVVDQSWEMMHPYVARMLKIWSMGLEPQEKGEFERTDFKKVIFRPVMILLFGLAAKFKLRGFETRGELIENLKQHLSGDEVKTLVTALAFANQSRSLYQIISGERSRSRLSDSDLDFIRRVMADQGVNNYDEFMTDLGRKVEAIRSKYFGNDFTMELTIPWVTNKIASIASDDHPVQMLKAVMAENFSNHGMFVKASVMAVGHETLLDQNFFGFDVVAIYKELLVDDGIMDLTEEILSRTYEARHGNPGRVFIKEFFNKLRSLKKDVVQGVLSTGQIKDAFLEMQKMSREQPLENKYSGDARREFFRKGVEQVKSEYWKGYIVDLGADDNMLGDVLLQVHGDQIEHVEGIDIEERPDVHKGPKLGFSLNSEKTLLELSGKADVVVIRYALHHMTWQQQEDYLNKARRMLKPNGKIIIYEDTFALAQPLEVEGISDLHEKILALRAPYRQRLLLAALDTISIGIRDKHQPFPFTFRTAEEWAGFFQSTGYKILDERYFGVLTHDFFKAPLTIFVLSDDRLPMERGQKDDQLSQMLGFQSALMNKLASAGAYPLEELLEVGAAYGKDKETVLAEIQEIGRKKLIFSPDGKWQSFLFERDPKTGEPTGRVVSYKAAHENGLWHAGTYALFLTEEGNAIVQLRRDFNRYDITVGGAQELTWNEQTTGFHEAEEELHLKEAGIKMDADRFKIIHNRADGKPFFRKIESSKYAGKSGYSQEGVYYVHEPELEDNREVDSLYVVHLSKTEENLLLKYFQSHETDEAKSIEIMPLNELIHRVEKEPNRFASGLRQFFEDPLRRQDILPQIFAPLDKRDKAMAGDGGMLIDKGGIDLTPDNMNLQIQNPGGGIKFHMDAAMLQQLQKAQGFVPVIISIQPMTDLRKFLGLNVRQGATAAG